MTLLLTASSSSPPSRPPCTRRSPCPGILPVIFSWHLGIRLNDVAKSATGAFDPQGFWLAWERGSEITVDTFGPQWNFWAVVHEPVGTSRRRYGIPPLDPAVDATLALLEPLTRGIRRHGDVRCQHHDADISTHLQLSAHRLQPLPAWRGWIVRPGPPSTASRAALTPWHRTCKPYWSSGLIFLTRYRMCSTAKEDCST